MWNSSFSYLCPCKRFCYKIIFILSLPDQRLSAEPLRPQRVGLRCEVVRLFRPDFPAKRFWWKFRKPRENPLRVRWRLKYPILKFVFYLKKYKLRCKYNFKFSKITSPKIFFVFFDSSKSCCNRNWNNERSRGKKHIKLCKYFFSKDLNEGVIVTTPNSLYGISFKIKFETNNVPLTIV